VEDGKAYVQWTKASLLLPLVVYAALFVAC
jgi:hypothetical protein